MIPYDEFRDARRAKIVAAWVAVAVTALLTITALIPHHKSALVWTGTFMVTIGTWIVANGAGLASGANEWLGEVEAQQAKQQTSYVHVASLLRQLQTMCKVIESPELLPVVRSNLAEEITSHSSMDETRYVISQSDLARLFIDSSRGSKVGTPIVIFGGILIALGAQPVRKNMRIMTAAAVTAAKPLSKIFSCGFMRTPRWSALVVGRCKLLDDPSGSLVAVNSIQAWGVGRTRRLL